MHLEPRWETVWGEREGTEGIEFLYAHQTSRNVAKAASTVQCRNGSKSQNFRGRAPNRMISRLHVRSTDTMHRCCFCQMMEQPLLHSMVRIFWPHINELWRSVDPQAVVSGTGVE